MKILFIGGNGNISWYCVQKAIEAGHEVWELNRSASLNTRKQIQPEVHKITADMRNPEALKRMLDGARFDAVCDFICFNEEHAKLDIEVFGGKSGHFIFISSESIYERKGKNLPFREDCNIIPLEDADPYIAGKIKAERVFMDAYRKVGFPVTVVRPAYTFDTIIPVSIGQNCFTAPKWYLKGYPALVAGDGTNLWSFTHASDFAAAFLPLIMNPETVGESFHIATDEWLTWNEELELLFHALGIPDYNGIHIPYKDALEITCFQPEMLMYQRMWHNIYDISKLRSYIGDWHPVTTFEEGIACTVKWLNGDPVRKRVNPVYDAELKKLYERYG